MSTTTTSASASAGAGGGAGIGIGRSVGDRRTDSSRWRSSSDMKLVESVRRHRLGSLPSSPAAVILGHLTPQA